MVKVVFTFKVPKEKQAEFLEFVKSGTKPWWECRALIEKFESYTIDISRKPYIKMT